MGTNVSKPVGKDYRALAIPDPRWLAANISAADTTITQANPRPGVPVANRKTPMVLETSGEQAAGQSLIVATQKGGQPGPLGASFIWKNAADSATRWRGWDTPTAIASGEAVTWETGTGDPTDGVLTTQAGAVLVGSTTEIRRRDPTTNAWAVSAVVTTPTSGTICFLQLPEGRIHAYCVVDDLTPVGAEIAQVALYISDDDGVTWSQSSAACLGTSIDRTNYGTFGAASPGYEVRRMRCAYAGGQVLILVSAVRHALAASNWLNTVLQYASSDLGISFSLVEIYSAAGAGDTSAGAQVDVCATPGGTFAAAYVQGSAPSVIAPHYTPTRVKIFGSAFDLWSSVPPVLASDAFIYNGLLVDRDPGAGVAYEVTVADVAVCVDEVGTLAVLWNENPDLDPNNRTANVSFSFDGGSLFSRTVGWPYPNTFLIWYRNDSSGGPPSTVYSGVFRFSATYQRGRIVVLTNYIAATSTRDNSLLAFYLGGYSTVTRPFLDAARMDTTQSTFGNTWTGIERFTNSVGWTTTAVGVPTEAQSNAAPVSIMTTIAAESLYKSRANSSSQALAEWGVTVGTGYLEIQVDEGATIRTLRISQVRTTGPALVTLLVQDRNGGGLGVPTTLYTSALPTVDVRYQVYVGFEGGLTSVWWRAANTSADREWTQATDSAAVASAVSAAAAYTRAGQEASTTSQWARVSTGATSGNTITGSSSNPADLYGHAYSGHPVEVTGGLRLAAVDGPTYAGDPNATPTTADTWSIATRYDYQIENVFADVAPSPRRTWRSVGTSSAAVLTVTLNTTGLSATPLLGSVLAIGVFNANFQQVQVSYRTGAGLFLALGTLMLNAGQTGLRWIREGEVVRPDTSGATSASDYFTYNILEDSHFRLDAVNDVRAIATNSEGTWTDTTATRTRLLCSGITGAEGASGTAGEIWSRDGMLLIHDMPEVRQLRFTIPAGSTAEGYFEIGNLFVGHVAYFGRQYSRGRALTWTPNYDLTTSRSGARRAQSLGPTRRGVEFAWANENETDASQLGTSPPDADYIKAASNATEGVGNPADTGWKMAGIVEALRGAVTPVVYLAKVPMVTTIATDTTQVNRNLFMLGRVVSEPRIDTVLGDEWAAAGELVRIATVSIEEEV